MLKMIERLEEHYEVHEVPFGRCYKWCPECLIVECDCGEWLTFERLAYIDSGAICVCGADLSSAIQEEAWEGHQPEVRGQNLGDYEATHHPWLYDTRAQEDQHLRDEVAYPRNSPWRYNDITS